MIPREGGYLVRLYVELDNLDADERVASRNITSDDLIAKAQRILHPHTLEVKEVAWWSVYEIGQRLSTSSTTCRRKTSRHACPVSSSPAMPATPTAPKRARA